VICLLITVIYYYYFHFNFFVRGKMGNQMMYLQSAFTNSKLIVKIHELESVQAMCVKWEPTKMPLIVLTKIFCSIFE
jgi:hypothetical protein